MREFISNNVRSFHLTPEDEGTLHVIKSGNGKTIMVVRDSPHNGMYVDEDVTNSKQLKKNYGITFDQKAR